MRNHRSEAQNQEMARKKIEEAGLDPLLKACPLKLPG